EVDAVRRGGHEDEPLLLLHPREERREDAPERGVAAARLASARDRHLDLVDPKERGGQRLHRVERALERLLWVVRAEDEVHVQAEEREVPERGDGLHRERLSAARY